MSTPNLVGTQTAINLAKAFAGESQARNRYQFYGDVAKKAGYASLENIFFDTANDERGHGEMFFEYLSEGLPEMTLEPQILVPVGLADTGANLMLAAKGEYLEWTQLYPSFAAVAAREGFSDIATSFSTIADVERRHDMRFRDMHNRLLADMLYRACHSVTWECLNCGHRHVGKCAPNPCPACHHEQNYFLIVSECIL